MRQTTETKFFNLPWIYITMSFIGCCQIAVYNCHNVYTFVDIFPIEDSCACDERQLEFIGVQRERWLHCYCYLEDDEKVYPFVISYTDSNDDQAYNIRVQIEIHYDRNVSVTRDEYLNGTHFSSGIALINDTSFIKNLNPDYIWKNPNIFYTFICSGLAFCMYYSFGICFLIFTFHKLGEDDFKIVQDMFSFVILLFDAYSVNSYMVEYATKFSNRKDSMIFPLVAVTVCLLGIIGVYMFILNNFNIAYRVHPQRKALEYTQSFLLLLIIILLFAARIRLGMVIFEIDSCSITLHVNCKIAVFRERSSTYHGKDGHKD